MIFSTLQSIHVNVVGIDNLEILMSNLIIRILEAHVGWWFVEAAHVITVDIHIFYYVYRYR